MKKTISAVAAILLIATSVVFATGHTTTKKVSNCCAKHSACCAPGKACCTGK